MLFRTLLATTAIALTSPAAFAQEAPITPPSPQEGELASSQAPEEQPAADAVGLGDIVVTAQFRRESAQRAAIPIDVVNSEALERAGVLDPTQLTTLVPSVQISQSGAGAQSFFIRGVGTLTANSYTDPGVAFNVDGIYIGRPTSARNIFFDIQRVEVLKGPQGTLYGRNATGGAINVIPNTPVLDVVEGSVGASYGNHDDVRLDAAVNIPLGANVAARLAGQLARHDGYLSDGTNDAKSYAARGQILFEPTDSLSLRVSADFAHDGGNGNGATITAFINPLTGESVLDPVSRSVGLSDPRVSAIFESLYSFQSGRFGQGVSQNPFVDNDYWGIKAEAGLDTGVGTLTVLASHRASDLNGLDFGVGFPAFTDQKDNQDSIEARFASPDTGFFRWLVGAYYFDEDIRSNYQFNLFSLTSIQDLETGTSSKATFGRITLAPTDELRLVGGIRYTDEKKRFDGVSNVFINICTAPAFPIPACPNAPFFPFSTTPDELIATMGLVPVIPGALYIQPTPEAANTVFARAIIPIDDTIRTKKTTYRAAVEYDVAPNNLLYASFETGFHAGGFAFAEIAPTFRPETIQAWTIGSKNRFFGGRLQVNAEAFLWKYKDQQVSHFASDVDGRRLVFITENAGRSTNKGVELSVLARPFQGTTLRLDTQYLKAKYDEFTYSLPLGPTAPPPVTGCPLTPVSPTLALVDCSGRTALRSPKWTINAGLEQVIPMGAYQFVATVDTHYQSSNIVGFEMLPGISTQEAYTLSNASLDFGPADGKWVIGAFINNIENERPIGQSFFNNQFNTFASSPLAPRTYGVRARFNW